MDLSSISLAGHAYLDSHNLKVIFRELAEQLATEMPADPMTFIVRSIENRNSALGYALLTCGNSWCGSKVPSHQFAEHQASCSSDRWTKCVRCDQRVEVVRIHQHRMNCHLVTCPECGECVLPRMLSLCPLAILRSAPRQRSLTNVIKSPKPSQAVVAVQSGTSGKINDNWEDGSPSTASLEHRVLTPDEGANNSQQTLRALQRLWRRRHARSTFNSLAFKAIWNLMDFTREGKVAQSRNDYACGSAGDKGLRKASVENLAGSPRNLSGEEDRISSDYTDVFRQDIFGIITSRHVVEFPVALKILGDATRILSLRPVVMHIQTPTDGEVVVVGDLHGQLKDLLHIMTMHGMPCPTKYFIFNGDFVDRGPYGVEVLLYIYVLLCSFPRYVWINRGNHEDYKTNCEYGLQDEVVTKYDDDHKEVLDAMVRSYKAMPLVTVIDKRVLVLHGGLPRHIVTLERIAYIGKIRDIPTVEQTDEDEEIVCDILWSDPVERYKSRRLGARHQGDHWRTSARGCGIEYLDGHTEQFLALNELELIVRSHEMVAAGYELCHQGRCVTVFSASDYCGVSGNRAAVVVFAKLRDEPIYQTWFIKDDVSDTLDFESSMKFDPARLSFDEESMDTPTGFTEVRPRVEDDCIQQLQELIWMKRYELLSTFCAVDSEQVGVVSKVEWCEVVRKVVEQPDLPWYYICPFLANVVSFREVPSVRYAEFVAGVDSDCGRRYEGGWLEHIVCGIFGSMELPDDLQPATKEHERLAQRRHSSMLENQLKQSDQSKRGSVVFIPSPPHSPPSKSGRTRSETSDWVGVTATSTTDADDNALFADESMTRDTHSGDDPNCFRFNFNYFVSIVRAKSPLAASLEDAHMYVLFRFLDQDRDGHVVLGEMLKLIEPYVNDPLDVSDDSFSKTSPTSADPVEIRQSANHSRIEAWMYPAMIQLQRFFLGESNRDLRRLFRSIDRDRDGVISESDFHHTIKKVNRIIARPIEEDHMRDLFHAIVKYSPNQPEGTRPKFLELCSTSIRVCSGSILHFSSGCRVLKKWSSATARPFECDLFRKCRSILSEIVRVEKTFNLILILLYSMFL